MRKILTGEEHKTCALKYDNEIAENTNKLNGHIDDNFKKF